MGSTTSKEWFYLYLGNRRGPVSMDDICRKVASHDIYIDSTKVWKEGMADWVRLSDAKAFAPYIKEIRAIATKAEARVQQAMSAEGIDEGVLCIGVSRVLFNVFFYIGWLVPLALSIALLTELQVFQLIKPETVHRSQWIPLIPLAISVIALWLMAAKRMQHAGYRSSLGLTVLVPVVNFWTLFVCLCAPLNYRRKKILGRGAVVYFLTLCLAAASLVGGALLSPKMVQYSPLAVSRQITEMYENKTHFQKRFKQKIKRAAEEKKRYEESLRKKEEQAKSRNRAMQEKRGM